MSREKTRNDLLRRYKREFNNRVPKTDPRFDWNVAQFADLDPDSDPAMRPVITAAKIYMIAVHESVDAAVLWKLRNGGAL